jgi:SagB-type dehydrogenase family enzyme
VVCGSLDSLPAGVYHFNPRDRALTQLRQGHHNDTVGQAAAGLPDVIAAPAVLVFTAISWRSAWKYRSRAYRYHYWDNGTIIANALAVCTALNLRAKLVMGFIDEDISRLVGIDGRREIPLSLLAIGSGHRAANRPIAAACRDDAPPDLETVPLSGCEIEYPLIPYMHAQSSLADGEEVQNWRSEGDRGGESKAEAPASTLIPLRPHSIQTLPTDNIEGVILRRASTRRFARKHISFEDLSTVIDRSTRGLACDFAPGTTQLNDVYIIVSRVDGLDSGAYYHRRQEQSLELLRHGDFSNDAAYLTLEQDLGGDSSATLFYMTDLDSVLSRLGNRGYRSAQIEAGVLLGKAYIAAYALGRGATGLTFYDDDVTAFFSPHAAGKSCTVVVAIGVPGKRPIV